MADLKISQLSDASALTGTELMELVQSGGNLKTTVSNLLSKVTAAQIIAALGYTPISSVQTLTFTGLKSASYTIVSGDFVLMDCSSGNLNASLPLSPADGTLVAIKMMAGQQAGNLINLIPAGSNKIDNLGSGVAYQINIDGMVLTLKWNLSLSTWIITSSYKTVSL